MIEMIYIEPKQAAYIWPLIAEMIRGVLAHTMGEQSETLLLRKVERKELFLCIFLEDKSIIGYTLFRDYVDGLDRTCLLVQHVFLVSDAPANALEFVNEQMEMIARKGLCDQIEVYTTREGLGRRISSMGFKQGYIQFVKQIGG